MRAAPLMSGTLPTLATCGDACFDVAAERGPRWAVTRVPNSALPPRRERTPSWRTTDVASWPQGGETASVPHVHGPHAGEARPLGQDVREQGSVGPAQPRYMLTHVRQRSLSGPRCQLFDKVSQPLAARWVTQLAQRRALNLTNAFSTDAKSLADLLQGPLMAVVKTEA